MTNEKIKRMLDACYLAKRIREMLPPLPARCYAILHSIHGYDPDPWKNRSICVKVSDISDALNTSAPGSYQNE